jgi:hypothetical protein
MVAFDSRRIGQLFRERAQIADELNQVRREAESLTLEHNTFIREAEQASTAGGRQRAQARAYRKGQEAARARANVEQISRSLHQKETEIADLIGALWDASQSLLSADTMRQLNDRLAGISQRLQRIDEQVRPMPSMLTMLQASLEDQAQGSSIDALLGAAGDAAAALADIRYEVGRQSRSLQAISSRLQGQADRPDPPRGLPPIVQVGWRPGSPAATERHSPQLPAQEVESLPEKVMVLVFASEPRDQPRADLDKELREILAMIDEAKFGDHINLRAITAAQAFDLIPNFNRHNPHMVQFSGHGTAAGFLMMGPRDRSEPVEADRIIQMLKWTGKNLRIVFFNICDSEEHARAAARLVEASIGMRGKMHDTPARMFAAHLYSGLAFGNSLKTAFHQACAAIGDEPDSAVPQLFFRNGTDPHKIVLVHPGR